MYVVMSRRSIACMIWAVVLCFNLMTVVEAQAPDDVVGCRVDLFCESAIMLVTKEACCNNTLEPPGVAFTVPAEEGCNLCPITFGFDQTLLVGPEQSESFVVGVGFATGVPQQPMNVNIVLTLGTASTGDVVVSTQSIFFPAGEPLMTSIELTFVGDGIALEEDETFSLSIEGIMIAMQADTVIVDKLDGVIQDSDVVQLRFQEADFTAAEGTDNAVVVTVEKDSPIASPLTFSVAPFTIEEALTAGIISEFEPENPLSPNRAMEEDFNQTVIVATFPADDTAPTPTSALEVPIFIVDDDINEASQQFIAHLDVSSPTDSVVNDIQNTTVGIILDNDPLRIGFEMPLYTFMEPPSLTSFPDDVFLIKEENRSTEQTFSVLVTASDPTSGVSPATLQSTNTSVEFDYVIGAPGQSSIELVFPPALLRLPFVFSLNGDDVFEETEGFLVTSAPSGIPFDPPVTSFSSAEIQIIDDDDEPVIVEVVVGFFSSSFSASESDGQAFVEFGVVSGVFQGEITLSLTLEDGTAQLGLDYEAPPANTVFVLNATTTSLSVAIPIVDDEIVELNETFRANLASVLLPSPSEISVTIEPATAEVVILDNDIEVNDNITGDPFFTVPILLSPERLKVLGIQRLSLCYEVHGKPDLWFNLVTEECTTINAQYVYLSREGLNVIGKIGVRAVDENGQCVDILVDINQCSASVNGADLAMMERYSSGGVNVRRYSNRVRISVPNCAELTLGMWVTCQHDQPGDMLKLVVTRGLNFGHRKAHGLLGQFWNVPADITPYEGQLLGGKPASSWYTVSITTAGHSRKYSGYIYSLDWEGDSVPCLYVGNNEGGPVSEAAGEESGVIDGSYRDYVVGGPFSEENYVFGIFKEEKCVK